jgi:hypothetical protein
MDAAFTCFPGTSRPFRETCNDFYPPDTFLQPLPGSGVGLNDPFRSQPLIYDRGDLVVTEAQGFQRAAHDRLPIRNQPSELDLGAPAEALLPCTIGASQSRSQRV